MWRPFRGRNGNHHSVVGSCQFARQIIPRKVFPFGFRSMNRIQCRLHNADYVIGQKATQKLNNAAPG